MVRIREEKYAEVPSLKESLRFVLHQYRTAMHKNTQYRED